MEKIATVTQIREGERAFFEAYPDIDLMQIAARKIAENAERMIGENAKILVAVGGGNNGGDGLFAARDLALKGHELLIWQSGDNILRRGLDAALAVGAQIIDEPLKALADVDLVIDAVYGIGGRLGLPENIAQLAQLCAVNEIPVLSVDIASGLAADSVEAPVDSFKATRTVTFGALKLCQVAYPAADHSGEVIVEEIFDVPQTNIQKLDSDDLKKLWPLPSSTSDKYSRGVLGVDTGSQRFPGAALLSLAGASYSGAGFIRYCGPVNRDLILLKYPSVTFGFGRVNAWLVGCGWGEGDHSRLQQLLAKDKEPVALVMDAESLELLPLVKMPEGSLLTPHSGELARLLGVARKTIEKDPITYVRQAAKQFNAAVLLKGATQYCANPQGDVLIAVPGSHWSARAGSGDILAGICGTLLAAGVDGWYAGVLAASVQAIAANRHFGSFPPEEQAPVIASVIGEFENKASR